MTLSVVEGWCVCVCVRGQLHSCRSITLQSFGPLYACQTLSPPCILINDQSYCQFGVKLMGVRKVSDSGVDLLLHCVL